MSKLQGYTARYLVANGDGKSGVYLASEVNARIAELSEVISVYARHRSNCQVHFKDECTCGWDEKQHSL